MTDPEKIMQLRTLHDAQAFQRKVVSRVPRDLSIDTCTMECGHTASVPRMYDLWECGECRKPFEPEETELSSILRRPPPVPWYRQWRLLAPAIPLLLWLVWFVVMVPGWIQSSNDREREYQELKQRVTRLEERTK